MLLQVRIYLQFALMFKPICKYIEFNYIIKSLWTLCVIPL